MKTASILAVSMLLWSTSAARAWEKLAHTYMADQIGETAVDLNADEIYGCIAPDIANYMLGSPYRRQVYDQAHYDFMRVWRLAQNGTPYTRAEALAFGFVVHNDVWGADSTAHHEAMTTLAPDGAAEGYIITKANGLNEILTGAGVWLNLGIDGPEYAEVRREICHTVIEHTIDIHVWEIDPGIGGKLVDAVQNRSEAIKDLLRKAFAGELVAYSNQNGMRLTQPDAVEILFDAEAYFRQVVTFYGSIFAQEGVDLIKSALAQYLANLAHQAYGLSVDASLVLNVIDASYAMTLDCYAEIAATIEYVEAELAEHKVSYEQGAE